MHEGCEQRANLQRGEGANGAEKKGAKRKKVNLMVKVERKGEDTQERAKNEKTDVSKKKESTCETARREKRRETSVGLSHDRETP